MTSCPTHPLRLRVIARFLRALRRPERPRKGTAAADTTAYLAITSAEKRSGKTRLLEVLELVVHAGLPTANTSDAALFRTISELGPTLLLDEVDAIF